MREILEKLDKIQEDIGDIKEVQAKNTSDIEYHIKRTDLAEESITLLRQQMIEEIKPIKSHISFVKGAIWALGIACSLLYALEQMGILKKLFA